MSQRDKVLELLRAAGSRGVHTFELRAEFIGNPSQRIAELEALGHKITHTRERLRGSATGTRYRLLRDTGVEGNQANGGGDSAGRAPRATTVQDTTPATGRLFDPAITSRPAGAYDDLEAA